MTKNLRFVDDEDDIPGTASEALFDIVPPKTRRVSATKKETHEEERVMIPSSGHLIAHLPSSGKLGYPETVEYRDLMVSDEELLATATKDTYARVLNGVLKSVMNNCPFFEQMSIHDRDYMLVWIWANNYDNIKHVEVECAHCGNKESKKIDLTALNIEKIQEDFKPFIEIPIKKTGGTIKVRPHTVAGELLTDEYVRKHPNERFDYVQLVASIDVGAEVPMEAKIKWVKDNISSREMQVVRAYHNKFSFGIESSIAHECTACKGVTHGPIPFQTADVLFPTSSIDITQYL